MPAIGMDGWEGSIKSHLLSHEKVNYEGVKDSKNAKLRALDPLKCLTNISHEWVWNSTSRPTLEYPTPSK